MALTKTTAFTVVDAWQAVVAASIVVGTPYDLSASFASQINIEAALIEAVAHETGLQILIDVSYADERWVRLTSFRGTPETPATTTINDADVQAAETVITLTDATTGDFDVKDRLWFIKDGTIANSEAIRTRSNATHVVTLESPLANAHANSLNVYDRADHWALTLPFPCAQVRVSCNNDDADCDGAFTSWISKVTAVA